MFYTDLWKISFSHAKVYHIFVGAYEVCYNQAKNHSMWSGYVDQNEIRNYRTLVVVREKEAWTNAEITVTVNSQQAQYNPPAGKI